VELGLGNLHGGVTSMPRCPGDDGDGGWGGGVVRMGSDKGLDCMACAVVNEESIISSPSSFHGGPHVGIW
jgi:hypothetical protein